MKLRLFAAACLALCALPVQAYYVYKFEFDAARGPDRYYPAASFEFATASLLLDTADSATVSPVGDLNGFIVDNIAVSNYGWDSIEFTPNGRPYPLHVPWDVSIGDVVHFVWATAGGTSPGVFHTNAAGRYIYSGPDHWWWWTLYANGTLTITRIPEPGSLALLGLGLAGLGFSRWRKK